MAKRHPVTRRTRTPAQAEAPEDLFVEKTLVMSSWARQNRQALTLAGIGLAVLLAGGLYYLSYRSRHLEQAAVELERARQNVLVGDTAAATVELSQYLQSFGNTPYGTEASLLLGELYLGQGRPADAAETLTPAAKPNDPLGVQAAILLARAHEEQGNLDQAERLYLDVADDAELAFQRYEALADAARLRESQGNAAGAAELYQRILDDIDEDAPLRPVYQMRLAEAQARAS